MTPSIAIVHIQTAKWRGTRLWIPLFLLWIPLALLSPILLLLLLGYSVAARVNPLRAISALWGMSCGLTGTHVDIRASTSHVMVRVL